MGWEQTWQIWLSDDLNQPSGQDQNFTLSFHVLNSSQCSFGNSFSLQGKEKVLGGREIFFLVGQCSGGSGTHLTLIHPWLNVLNSSSTYGLLLHSYFITLPAKLRGLRDDIAIKGWRVLMPRLPWKLLLSSPTCLHYFQLCSQLHIERMQERQKSLLHFSSTSCKENGGFWAQGKKGDPLQIIWRWCLQGTKVQIEELSWHQKNF